MKIGIIYCCYGNPEYIDDCLKPWIEAKKSHDILIAAVHGQFKEYHDLGIEDNDEETKKILANKFEIDYLYVQNDFSRIGKEEFLPVPSWEKTVYQTEAEIRDKGLQWLLKQNCDYIWLLDNDEFYTIEQINKIIEYIGKERFITWFSIPFRNYIFDGKQWINGFCPPRVFSTNSMGRKLHSFFWDNDVNYTSDGRQTYSYKTLANKSIPRNILEIKHLTWLHSNGKLKYEYQMKHFGHCGYKWNYDTNELEINKEFYIKNNMTLPKILKDDN